ncbi:MULTISPECIES: DUF6398 domain-containing protein [unclassified Cupriavidus]|uniref:DUF6398 domain-containing protein n=1 Tax=unclassified Cupriavidus TaxID=2640874 RepID=UPI001AE3B31C|nr:MULTISPECIES: DUF6398 domain-containing protein [unclassified Cupriavidus]MBP0633674.1 hypothetical protein [Cupriavidus sp. AcVe19-1a]MBP0640173.1 hypothetical protein [Cupriavidus sp. AcVe19-6a]
MKPTFRGERVPGAMQDRYDEIIALTDAFCAQHLTDEYRDLCRRLVATLCCKRPSPLVTGPARPWACGVAYAIGRVNFLFDKSYAYQFRSVFSFA